MELGSVQSISRVEHNRLCLEVQANVAEELVNQNVSDFLLTPIPKNILDVLVEELRRAVVR